MMQKSLWQWSKMACMAWLALLASACGGLMESNRPVDRIFLLQPFSEYVGEAGTAAQRDLGLLTEVVPGLDSDRLLTLSRDGEIKPLAGARWPEHLPEFAGSVLRRSLRAGGWFKSVSDGRIQSADACLLTLEIQSFFARLNPSGVPETAQVQFSGELRCDAEAWPLNIESSAGIAAGGVTASVTAFQAALDQATRDLLEQVKKSLASHAP
jgi:ABC-type uncharacterized transport system auxiliary subunit